MDSYTKNDAYGMTYVGPDATRLFQALTLRNAISIHKKTGMTPCRGMGIQRMFMLAQKYTGKKYKRGQHDLAITDLTIWIHTMRSALPDLSED